jgi:hypothetical protein
MEYLILPLFVLNIVLTLADASVGYHKVPEIVAAFNDDPDGSSAAAKDVSFLIPFLVALYVALDCHAAWNLRDVRWLAGLSLLLTGDMLLQLRLAARGRKSRT